MKCIDSKYGTAVHQYTWYTEIKAQMRNIRVYSVCDKYQINDNIPNALHVSILIFHGHNAQYIIVFISEI